MPGSQRGMALLVVMWGATLAAITVGALAVNARVEGMQARAERERTQLFYAAQAGVERAVYGLAARDDGARWASDGRSYTLAVGDIGVAIAIADEQGKINLNKVDTATMARLLEAIDVPAGRVVGLSQAIQDWGAQGKEGGALLDPGGFVSIEELARVPGMDEETYRKLEPNLTLWSTGEPTLSHASPAVLAAVAGMPIGAAEEFVAQLRHMPAAASTLPSLPNGVALSSGGRSAMVTVTSTAVLRDRASLRLRITLWLRDDPDTSHAYRVLRWQEDVGG